MPWDKAAKFVCEKQSFQPETKSTYLGVINAREVLFVCRKTVTEVMDFDIYNCVGLLKLR